MQDDLGKRLGRRIKQHREAAGLTQNDLAQLMLKSVETISNIERGKVLPSVRTLALLAEELSVPMSAMFDDVAVASRRSDVETAIASKSRLLNEDNRALVLAIVELMVKQQGSAQR